MAKNEKPQKRKLIDILYDYEFNVKKQNKYTDEWKNTLFNAIMYRNVFNPNGNNKNKKQ